MKKLALRKLSTEDAAVVIKETTEQLSALLASTDKKLLDVQEKSAAERRKNTRLREVVGGPILILEIVSDGIVVANIGARPATRIILDTVEHGPYSIRFTEINALDCRDAAYVSARIYRGDKLFSSTDRPQLTEPTDVLVIHKARVPAPKTEPATEVDKVVTCRTRRQAEAKSQFRHVRGFFHVLQANPSPLRLAIRYMDGDKERRAIQNLAWDGETINVTHG